MAMLPTLGQQTPAMQAPVAPVTSLGQIEAQLAAARQQQQLAQALMSTGYVPNSGALGAFAQAFSAYRGNKLERNANETVAQALQRKFEEDSRLKQAEANANDPINQRTDYLKRSGMDPDSEAGRYYLLTGKLPPAANRGPMNVSPGGAIVDPSTGKVVYQAPFAPREAPKPGSGGPADQVQARRVALETEILPGLQAELGEAFTPEMQRDVVTQYLGTGEFSIKPKAADKKAAQGASIKGAQLTAIKRDIDRLDRASESIAGNTMLDGGPIDGTLLANTAQGQELEQAAASIMPKLTALTRVPGVGAQSDLETRLNQLQLPSADMHPAVRREAVKALRAYMSDLESALQGSGASAAAPAANVDALLEKYR